MMANLSDLTVSGNTSLSYCIRSTALAPIALQDELGGNCTGKTVAPSHGHTGKAKDSCGFQPIGAHANMPSHNNQYPSLTAIRPSQASSPQHTVGPGGSIATEAEYLSLSAALDIARAARLAMKKHSGDWMGVTVTWAKLSHPRQPWTFGQFINRLAEWLRQQWSRLGIYIWVRECGPVLGDHIHMLLAVPKGIDGGTVRKRMEAWFRNEHSLCLQPQEAALRVRATDAGMWLAYVLKVAPTDYDRLHLEAGVMLIPNARKPAGIVESGRWGCARKVDKGAQAAWAKAHTIAAPPICTIAATSDPATGEILGTASDPTRSTFSREISIAPVVPSTAADKAVGTLIISRDMLRTNEISVSDIVSYVRGIMPSTIRKAVKLAMLDRGVTSDSLACWLGVGQPHLMNSLSGHDPLSPSVIAQLRHWLEDDPPIPLKRRKVPSRKAPHDTATAAPGLF